MKKLLSMFVLVGLLVACGGPKYQLYPITKKQELVVKAYVEEDQAAKKEVETVLKQLKKAVDKNDEKALKEYNEWMAFIVTYKDLKTIF